MRQLKLSVLTFTFCTEVEFELPKEKPESENWGLNTLEPEGFGF